MMRRGAAAAAAVVMPPVLAMVVLAACAAGPSGLPSDDRAPADFALGVTVLAPADAGAGAPRGARPARFIVQPDGVLHAAEGPVTERTFPPAVRWLTSEQVERLWWELRDSGLVGGAADAPPHPAAPPPGATAPAYVVSWLMNGRRGTARVDANRSPPERVEAARRLADRLAALAWMTD
jgi:hypothetical protein